MSNLKKNIRRFGFKIRLKSALKGKKIYPSVAEQTVQTLGYSTDSLLSRHLMHVGPFSPTNAGDGVLSLVLRDLFSRAIPGAQWRCMHVHDEVHEKELGRINHCRAVIVGGGGLFLRDTNRNNISGWQWPIGLKEIDALNVPLVLFAVGYNRFRKQGEFDDFFVENLRSIIAKAGFVGIRNRGSMAAIRSYLAPEFHEKIKYQPCMTTVIRHIYPGQFKRKEGTPAFIGLNCAFDRSDMRFGDRKDAVLKELARSAKTLSKTWPIKYYAHCGADEEFLPYLDAAGVPYENVPLYRRHPRVTVEALSQPALVIGMRGHAQMIPIGCGVPILSLISHDKMRWFLEDIGAPEWGVDMLEPGLHDGVVEKARMLLEGGAVLQARIEEVSDKLWATTQANLREITGLVFGPDFTP